jgi:hypothetical protein
MQIGTACLDGDARACSMFSPLGEQLLNTVGGFGRFDVLPHSDRQPSRLDEVLISVSIARLICDDFGRPVSRVTYRDGVVVRTAMPEATIDEDSHFFSREHNIGGSSKPSQRAPVDEISKPTAMQYAPHRKFWACVSPAVGLHVLANSGCRRPRIACLSHLLDGSHW